jgi:transcriptional regulator with XRE-family HTH domain
MTGGGTGTGTGTVRGRRLGSRLRALRGELTLEEVAARSGGAFTFSKLSRLENARSAAKAEDVGLLLDVYAELGREVPGTLRSALVELAREGVQRGWWRSYRGLITPEQEDLISLEADAGELLVWGAAGVPGLLQTAEYAREEVVATAPGRAPGADPDALVQVRLARQSVLTRERPPQLHAVLAEAALRAGAVREGDGVMRDQLARLLALGGRPNVRLQVLPDDAPPHPGRTGSFDLLAFGGPGELDVVHVEGLTRSGFVEEAAEVAAHREAFGLLAGLALSPEASAARIARLRGAG